MAAKRNKQKKNARVRTPTRVGTVSGSNAAQATWPEMTGQFHTLETLAAAPPTRWGKIARWTGSPVGVGIAFAVPFVLSLWANVSARALWYALINPCLPGTGCDVSAPNTAFWLGSSFAAAWVMLGAVASDQERAAARSREQARDETLRQMKATMDNLPEALRDMPHSRILSRYADVLQSAIEARIEGLARAESTKPLNEYDETIRVLLKAIATFVYEYMGGQAGDLVAANVMLFVDAAGMSAPERASGESILRFCERPVPWPELAGVLQLQLELSTSTRTAGSEADRDLPVLALPVRRAGVLEGGRPAYLPGAPEAYDRRAIVAFSPSEIRRVCRGRAIPTLVVDEMCRYFSVELAKKVTSVACIPLDHNTNNRIVGVLNLHSNSPHLLRSFGEAESLHQLLRPLVDLVVRMLEGRARKAGQSATNVEPKRGALRTALPRVTEPPVLPPPSPGS